MADFSKGDRIVKMSGTAAGKYGTVNSVREDGTLNVTFDGERLSRFCDPERCGKVAANAKFKVGDRVKSAKYPELGEMKVERVFQDIHGTAYRTSRDGFLTDDIHYDRTLIPANARACNAKFKVGDKVKFTVDGRMQVGTVLRVYGGPHDMYDVKVGASTLTLADTPIFAANREFAPGDKVCIDGRAGMERGEKVETIERVEGEGRDKFLFFKGSKWGRPARMYAYANACAKNASADDATGRRDIEQSLRKMADFAAKFTGAKASATPTHSDYNFAGYIDLKFPDGDKADALNPYYLIDELNGNKSFLPKWAWGIGGFNYERRGSVWRINIGRFST